MEEGGLPGCGGDFRPLLDSALLLVLGDLLGPLATSLLTLEVAEEIPRCSVLRLSTGSPLRERPSPFLLSRPLWTLALVFIWRVHPLSSSFQRWAP